MSRLFSLLSVALLLNSCCRNLGEEVTLMIDPSAMDFNVTAGNHPSYFDPSDSSSYRQEVLSDLHDLFVEKGNDVHIVSSNAQYTLVINSCSFHEDVVSTWVLDPCDTIAPYDTLRYTVSKLTVYMDCTLKDAYGHSKEIVEESSDEENVKDHPTILQSLFGHDECYTPRVSHILDPGKLQRRVLRRVHREALCTIKSWF